MASNVNISGSRDTIIPIEKDIDVGAEYWICYHPTVTNGTGVHRYSVTAFWPESSAGVCVTYEDTLEASSDSQCNLPPEGGNITFCNDWSRSFRVGLSFPNATTAQHASVLIVIRPLSDSLSCTSSEFVRFLLIPIPVLLILCTIIKSSISYYNSQPVGGDVTASNVFSEGDDQFVSVVSSGGGMRSMIIFQGLMAYLFCHVDDQSDYTVYNILSSTKRESLPQGACSKLFRWTNGWKLCANPPTYKIKGISAVSGSTYALSSFLSFLGPDTLSEKREAKLNKAYKDMLDQSRQKSDVFVSGGIFTFIVAPVLLGSLFGTILVVHRMIFAAMAQFNLCNCGGASICKIVGIPVCPNFLPLSDCQLQSSFHHLFYLTMWNSVAIAIWAIVQLVVPHLARVVGCDCPVPCPCSTVMVKVLVIIPLWDTLVAMRWFVEWFMDTSSQCDGDWWDFWTIVHWCSFAIFLVAFFLYQYFDSEVGTALSRAAMIGFGYLAIGVILMLASLMSYFLTSTEPLSTLSVVVIDCILLLTAISSDLCAYLASKLPHRWYVQSLVSSFWKKDQDKIKLRDFSKSSLGPFYFNAASHDVSDRSGTSSSIVLSSLHSWAHAPFHKDRYASEGLAKSDPEAGLHNAPDFLGGSSRLTKRFDTPPDLLMKDAVAVSGAAVASNMGRRYNVPMVLRWLMSMFSLNMGVWITLRDSPVIEIECRNRILGWIQALFTQPLILLGALIFYPMVISTLLQSDRLMDGTLVEPQGSGWDVSEYICIGAIVFSFVSHLLSWVCVPKIDACLLAHCPFYRRMKEGTMTGTYHDCPVKQCSDGGHVDNLGLLPIILDERREKKIIALDAGYDPNNTQEGLSESLRMVQHYCSNYRDDIFFEYDVLRPPTNLRRRPMRQYYAVPNTDPSLAPEDSQPTEQSTFIIRDEDICARESCNVITWTIFKRDLKGTGKVILKKGEIFYLRSVYSYNFSRFIDLFRLSDPEFPHRPTTDPAYALHEYEVYLRFGAHLLKNNEAALKEFLCYRHLPEQMEDEPIFEIPAE